MTSDLITTLLFSQSDTEKQTAKETIWQEAKKKHIIPSSLFTLYSAIGQQEIHPSFTVPAINIRTLTYDTARVIFSLMKKHHIGPVIFEIARSEMGYTKQTPGEYSAVVLLAAIDEGYTGPVFFQGDHFQINKLKFDTNPTEEIASIEKLITESVSAKFYNIDIDGSTLVALEMPTISKQQAKNSEITAHLTSFIRKLQPEGIQIAIGGEIGHIGGVNSTTDDFTAFMTEYQKTIHRDGMSKVSVQTGSSHGGTVLPDGTVKQIAIDFSVLKTIGALAKSRYQLAGAVQHGASTLPLELFDKFPKNNTVEIHLATGFQNIVFETIPDELRKEMYSFIMKEFIHERIDGQTDEQFIYKLRKKSLGPFKKQLFELRTEEKQQVLLALNTQFEILFEKLGLYNTREILMKYYA